MCSSLCSSNRVGQSEIEISAEGSENAIHMLGNAHVTTSSKLLLSATVWEPSVRSSELKPTSFMRMESSQTFKLKLCRDVIRR